MGRGEGKEKKACYDGSLEFLFIIGRNKKDRYFEGSP
jgi:hypothetical protein